MKKKYLAIILGMALSIAPMSVFAEEETDAQEDVLIVEETEDAEEMTGRIDAVNEDGSVLISIGEMTEDEADEILGTLNLTGEELEAGFSDDVSAVGLIEYKTITVVEAAEDESTEEEESSEEVSSEDTDTDGEESVEEISSSEDTEAEDEENDEVEVETAEILTTDLEAGDIITFTVDENGDINTVTLIGVDVDTLDEAEASDAEEEDAEETSSDTEA